MPLNIQNANKGSMFFHLLYIHLFRPFLKYKPASSPLPVHVSPRKFLIQAATSISKLLRLYRRTYGLRQICNIAVYITHSACTVHLLNLPDKFANRDIVHGLNHLEEISESWLCARRTLDILLQVSRRWNIELPDAALKTFERAETRFGVTGGQDQCATPKSASSMPLPANNPMQPLSPLEAADPVSGDFFTSVVPNGSLLYATPDTGSASSTDPPHLNRSMNSLSHKAAALPAYYGLQNDEMSHPESQHQQEHHTWNAGQTAQTTAPVARLTSPTMLFHGSDNLIKDKDWWLQDSNQIFASWNGYEHHESPSMIRDEYSNDISLSNGEAMGNGVAGSMANTINDEINNGPINGSTYGYDHPESRHMDDSTNGLLYRR